MCGYVVQLLLLGWLEDLFKVVVLSCHSLGIIRDSSFLEVDFPRHEEEILILRVILALLQLVVLELIAFRNQVRSPSSHHS